MPEVLDPERLPETQPDGFDPNRDLLSEMGYDEPPTEAEEGPSLADRAENLKDRFDESKKKVGKFEDWRAKRAEKKTAAKLRKSERMIADQARRRVATQAESAIAKKAVTGAAVKAGATAATLGAEAAAGPVGWIAGAITILSSLKSFILPAIKKYWPRVVLILSFIFLLPAMVFGLLGLKGTDITPSTAAQYNQTIIAADFSGDFVLSGRKVTQAALDAEKERYQIILKNTQRTSPERLVQVTKDSQEIIMLLEQTINLTGEAKKKQTDIVIGKVQALDSTLPFGRWVADAALGQVGAGSQNFCRITGAASSVACASFVSTVLQDAGVPSPIKSTTTAVWRNPALRVIVDHLDNAVADRFAQSKSLLQPGDIIWWGDGTCSSVAYAGKEFDHIGFYVGNGMAVDNSSKASAIKERQAASRDSSCRFFNGAKRYGKNL